MSVKMKICKYHEGNLIWQYKLSAGRMEASCSSRPPKDISSLALIAWTYEDASDSETELREVSPVSGLDEESSRWDVFCVQHAIEVKQKLDVLGCMHMLLLCHPGKLLVMIIST